MLRKVLYLILTIGIIAASLCILPATGYAESLGKPVDLQMSDLTEYSASATLTWGTVPGAAGYAIYVNGAEVYVDDFTKERVTTASFQFTELAPDTRYLICVKAYDAAGDLSEASDVLDVTTGFVTRRVVGAGETYATIQAAVNAANPGDVILVKDGTYQANTNITKSGNSEKWITVRADDGAGPLVKGTFTLSGSFLRLSGFRLDARLDSGTLTDYGVNIKSKHTQVENMDICNYKFAIFTSVTLASHAYVAHNHLYKNCINIFTGNDSVYEYNDIENIDLNGRTGSGIDGDYFRTFGTNVIVRYNYCHGTFEGSHLGPAHVDFDQVYDNNKETAKNILIENNIATGHFGQGIQMSSPVYKSTGVCYISDWTIRNNIFMGYTAWGVHAGGDHGFPNVTVENNLFIGDPDTNGGAGAYYGIGFDGPATTGSAWNNIIINASAMSYGTLNGARIDSAGNNLTYNAVAPNYITDTDILGQNPLLANSEIGVNPLLLDPEPEGFRLQPASPAIENGAQAYNRYDIEGKLRPYGNGFDIGPIEFYGVKANTAPMITITAPQAFQGYITGSAVNIAVNARDDQGVSKVEYFMDGIKVGESTQQPFGFEIPDIQEGIHTVYGVAYDQEGLSTRSIDVSIVAAETMPLVVDATWNNFAFTPQQGFMTASFDVMPLKDNMNGVVALAQGEADAFPELAAIVRFNESGNIDAYNKNGANYFAENVIPYTAGKKYHITFNVDVPQNLYSVSVTDEEGNTHVLCRNFSFRASAATLDHAVAYAGKDSYVLLGNTAGAFIPTESVNITEDSIRIDNIGSTGTLVATILPADATYKDLQWTSSNPSVATVDANGVVTAAGKGTAIITVKVVGTTLADTCVVTVEQATRITLTAPQSVNKNQTFIVTIGVKTLDQILNGDLSILYNKYLVKYEGYKRIDGGLLVTGKDDNGQQGTGRFLLASAGTGNAVTGEVQLIELKFKAKEKIVNFNAVSVTSATLVDAQGSIVLPVLPDGTAPVLIPGDLNHDGLVNVVDLDIISLHYGKNWKSTDWNTARIADLNWDWKIDTKDLEFISKFILK